MTNPDLLMKANTASNAAMEALPGVDDMDEMERSRLFDAIGDLIVQALTPNRTDYPASDDAPATVRTTFTVVVLHEAETFEDRLRPYNMDLKDVLDWMDDGDAIGSVSKGYVEVLGAGEIRDALLDVGNDGTFFDALDDVFEGVDPWPVVIELDRENPEVGGRASDFIGRFASVAIAESFLSLSATIDPDRLNAGHYGICEMEPGQFCIDEPVLVEFTSAEAAGLGQVPVTVVRELTEAEADPEGGPMYEVRMADGSTGHAFAHELRAIPTELPEGIDI